MDLVVPAGPGVPNGLSDVYSLIVSALNKMSKPLEGLTVEDLAPVDHFHALGLVATVDLAPSDSTSLTSP